MFAQLLKEYEYDGIQTCAADGTCAEPCPVSINTGALIKSFRQRENTDGREKVALAIAKRWRSVETLARIGMGVADFISRTVGVRALTGLTAVARDGTEQRPRSVSPWTDAAEGATQASRRLRGKVPQRSIFRRASIASLAVRPAWRGDRVFPRRLSRYPLAPGNHSGSPITCVASAVQRLGVPRATGSGMNGWPRRSRTQCGTGATRAPCPS